MIIIIIRQAGCRSLPHNEGPNLGKSLLASRPILPARQLLPLYETLGILPMGFAVVTPRQLTPSVGRTRAGSRFRRLHHLHRQIFIDKSDQITSGGGGCVLHVCSRDQIWQPPNDDARADKTQKPRPQKLIARYVRKSPRRSINRSVQQEELASRTQKILTI